MTEMACPDGRDAQDQWLISILTSRPTISLTGNDLALVSGSITITLQDQEIAQPDQPLAGPVWMVTGLISGDAVSSIPDGVSAWLQFNEDGALALQTGCNGGGGRWMMTDGSLELGDLVMELRLCDGAAGQVESAVLAVLRAGPLSVEITSNSMTLSAGAAGLQLQAPGLD
jgi:heat shock protein HslJ